MEEQRAKNIFLKGEIVRNGESGGHTLILLRAGTLRERLGHDADVVDAGDAQCVDDRGKNSERNRLIAAQENTSLRILQLYMNFRAQLVNIDGVVAEVDALRLIDGDHEAILADGFYGLW